MSHKGFRASRSISASDRFVSAFAVWDAIARCSLLLETNSSWTHHLLALTAHDKWQVMEWGCGCLRFLWLCSLWWLMAICVTPAPFWEAIKDPGKRKMESTLTASLEAALNFLTASTVLTDHLIFICVARATVSHSERQSNRRNQHTLHDNYMPIPL